MQAVIAHYEGSSGDAGVGSGGDTSAANGSAMELPIVKQFLGLVAVPSCVSRRLSHCIALGLFRLKAANVYIVDSGCAIVASWDKNDFKPGSLKPAPGESLSGVGDEMHNASQLGTLLVTTEPGATIEIKNA